MRETAADCVGGMHLRPGTGRHAYIIRNYKLATACQNKFSPACAIDVQSATLKPQSGSDVFVNLQVMCKSDARGSPRDRITMSCAVAS